MQETKIWGKNSGQGRPRGPGATTAHSQCRGQSLIPGRGLDPTRRNRILHAAMTIPRAAKKRSG